MPLKSPEVEPVLRSRRLVLEPLGLRHLDGLLELLRESGVRRYLLDDQLVDREWVAAELARSRVLFLQHGCGLWSLGIRERGGMVGFCGYRFLHSPPELQLVCGLSPRHRRKGFATEACKEVIRYGFQDRGFERIVADTDGEYAAPGSQET